MWRSGARSRLQRDADAAVEPGAPRRRHALVQGLADRARGRRRTARAPPGTRPPGRRPAPPPARPGSAPRRSPGHAPAGRRRTRGRSPPPPAAISIDPGARRSRRRLITSCTSSGRPTRCRSRGPGLLGAHPGVGEVADDLLDEERVALGLAVQRPHEGRGRRAADPQAHQLAPPRSAQTADSSWTIEPLAPQPGRARRQSPRSAVHVAEGAQDRYARAVRRTGEVAQQHQRRAVGPVQVVEHDAAPGPRPRSRPAARPPPRTAGSGRSRGRRARAGAARAAGAGAPGSAGASSAPYSRATRRSSVAAAPRTRSGPAPPGRAGRGRRSPRARGRPARSPRRRTRGPPSRPAAASCPPRRPRRAASRVRDPGPGRACHHACSWAISACRPTSGPVAAAASSAGTSISAAVAAVTALWRAAGGLSSRSWAADRLGRGGVPSSSRSRERSCSNTRMPSATLPWASSAAISSTYPDSR